MIELRHSTTPRLLNQRKNNPNDNGVPANPRNAWNNFSTEAKREIHNSLTPLQNGLCVYCEEKLDKYGFHIEHILSKTLNPPLTFEYSNLSLSCIENGAISNETTPNPVSCGHAPLKKDNKYDENLFIKPTEIGCNALFQYKSNGEIAPANGISTHDVLRVKHTIEVLNLNCLRLKRYRREIINEGLNIILDLNDDSEALQNFLDLEFEVVNNKYVFPFISIRKQYYSLFRDYSLIE